MSAYKQIGSCSKSMQAVLARVLNFEIGNLWSGTPVGTRDASSVAAKDRHDTLGFGICWSRRWQTSEIVIAE